MRFGSLFSGIGGLDLGFERAGMKCVWQCEIDPKCQAVLKRHWPDTPLYSDVRYFHGEPGCVDLICGGFPCQDVSTAGRRAGLKGEQSGLWFEFHRVLSEIQPKWVVIENVVGLLSSHNGKDFYTILKGLTNLGYCVAWRTLDSQYFGVAQRRRRIFIIGSTGGRDAVDVVFDLEDLKSREDDPQDDSIFVSGSVLSKWHKGTGGPSGDECYNLVPHPFVFTSNQTEPVRQENLRVRRLTPTECERLQGFPDGWTEGQSDTSRYRMLGNAVTVQVAEWIASRILHVEPARVQKDKRTI